MKSFKNWVITEIVEKSKFPKFNTMNLYCKFQKEIDDLLFNDLKYEDNECCTDINEIAEDRIKAAIDFITLQYLE